MKKKKERKRYKASTHNVSPESRIQNPTSESFVLSLRLAYFRVDFR